MFDNGNCYLVGYCHMREAERMFHLGRIHGAELTERAFEPPADFDIQAYADRGWSASFYDDMKRDFPSSGSAYRAASPILSPATG
ncbi:MAG: WYL domain-containing protein [Candidatus Latescibacterota bacterium]